MNQRAIDAESLPQTMKPEEREEILDALAERREHPRLTGDHIIRRHGREIVRRVAEVTAEMIAGKQKDYGIIDGFSVLVRIYGASEIDAEHHIAFHWDAYDCIEEWWPVAKIRLDDDRRTTRIIKINEQGGIW